MDVLTQLSEIMGDTPVTTLTPTQSTSGSIGSTPATSTDRPAPAASVVAPPLGAEFVDSIPASAKPLEIPGTFGDAQATYVELDPGIAFASTDQDTRLCQREAEQWDRDCAALVS